MIKLRIEGPINWHQQVSLTRCQKQYRCRSKQTSRLYDVSNEQKGLDMLRCVSHYRTEGGILIHPYYWGLPRYCPLVFFHLCLKYDDELEAVTLVWKTVGACVDTPCSCSGHFCAWYTRANCMAPGIVPTHLADSITSNKTIVS